MKLDWIDDLIAIADAASLSDAADMRFLSQPAFSRRIRAIERSVGAELIDRSHKPIRLKKNVLDAVPKLREASQALHALQRELGRDAQRQSELVIVSQHAISTAIAPQLIKSVVVDKQARVRLRSANREDCYSLLFSHQADIGLFYQMAGENTVDSDPFVNTIELLKEPLVPVIASEQLAQFKQELSEGFIRVIAYPQSVFLGDVLSRFIQPQLNEQINIQWTAETALTTAALQFSCIGIGLAWVPLSLALPAVERKELIRLDESLPSVSMTVVAMRLDGSGHALLDSTWQAFIDKV